MPEGWLLDVHSSRTGDSVVLWLKERGGKAQRVEVPWSPPFYVTGPADRLEDLAHDLSGERRELLALGWSEIRTSLFDAADVRRRALAIAPIPHGARKSLAGEIDARGGFTTFHLFDVDLSAPQLFYLDRGLYPFAPVVWSGAEVLAKAPPETMDYEAPPLTGLRLAVEVAGGRPGRPPQEEDPVARVTLDGVALEGKDEEATLALLQEELRRQDPDILWTHGGDEFHLPHLYRRALAHGWNEEAFTLGREPTPFRLHQRGQTFESYGRILHRSPMHFLSGRFHLDVHESFVQDVGLAGFIDTSRLSRLGLQTIVRQSPGTAFSAMELARALEVGVHIPWKKNLPEREKTAAELVAADRGGFILTPPVGVEEGVDEFDFASLFPSIMVRHNLSLETLDCPCCPDSPHVAPGLGYRSCTLRQGVVPRTIAPLVERRLHFKAQKKRTTGAERERYDALGKAWKWVLVTSFGYQGYRNARFGRIECHEAINAYAREVLVELTRIAREGGWEVVHGIVDSLWLRPPKGGDPEAFARRVTERTGLPLGYEGRYRWIVFLPNREHGLGVAQRYYGRYAHGEFKLRGIEMRRGDACTFVQHVQGEALDLLGEAEDAAGFRARIPAALELGQQKAQKLSEGNWPREELLLTHRIAQPLEAYRVYSDGVAALRRLKEAGVVREAGEDLSYLIRDHGARDYRARAVPAELLEGDEPYDVAAYVELLARSFETLFLPFGWDLDRILTLWGWGRAKARDEPKGRYRSLERPGQMRLEDVLA
jgi:DNA polymerase elongation subunit (family B)